MYLELVHRQVVITIVHKIVCRETSGVILYMCCHLVSNGTSYTSQRHCVHVMYLTVYTLPT